MPVGASVPPVLPDWMPGARATLRLAPACALRSRHRLLPVFGLGSVGSIPSWAWHLG